MIEKFFKKVNLTGGSVQCSLPLSCTSDETIDFLTNKELTAIANGEKNYFEVTTKIKPQLYLDLKTTQERLAEVMNKEGFLLAIQKEKILIKGYHVRGLYYGLLSLKELLKETQGNLPIGEILDYPTLLERRFHLDMGRKYFTKEWIIRLIHQMSQLRLNTLQLHFAENMGFRLESEVAPEIVSKDGFLTKKEMKEIIEEAALYQIGIIPSLDTPGHVAHLLKTYPEYGQIDKNGNHSKVALDITNQKAIDFMKSLYAEYMELFSTSTIFHIGGDEYMEFDRPPFTTDYQEVLESYAKNTFGPQYTWKDTVANYINEIAQFVYEKGFTPRIWNDGIFYDEKAVTGPKQKIEMVPYLQVDFWCQMGWNPHISTLAEILNRGLHEIYNVNSNFFYYVLRTEMPTDGRLQHSFDVLNQDRNIYENWQPGVFSDNRVPDDSSFIKGVAMAVWNDLPDLVTEEVIAKDIEEELKTFAVKTWQPQINETLSYEEFKGI